MKFKYSLLCILIAAFIIASAAPGISRNSNYTPWGVEEYQLFGLTKDGLSKRFKNKLFFSDDFKRATFSKAPIYNYQGPVFYLTFTNGKVTAVQGIFEGCKVTAKRPHFSSKKAALNYAIKNLSTYTGAQEKKSLAQARQVLSELKRASGTPK